MLERILHYERDVFFFLNGSESDYWDHFMWLFSSKAVWFPLVLYILFILCYKKNWKEVLFILLAIVLVITICDQFASHFCKPYFARFRPTYHPDFKDQVETVFGYRSGKYGFISSHAANAFGFATFSALLFRQKLYGYTLFVWSCATAYTRIYLGVHFISDVVAGALAGVLFGYLVYLLYLFARRKILGNDIKAPEFLYSNKEKNLISYGVYVSVFVMLIFNIYIVDLLR